MKAARQRARVCERMADEEQQQCQWWWLGLVEEGRAKTGLWRESMQRVYYFIAASRTAPIPAAAVTQRLFISTTNAL